jgi:hypothetical protein
LIEGFGQLGQVSPESVLRERDAEPTGDHLVSLGPPPGEAPARIVPDLGIEEGAP